MEITGNGYRVPVGASGEVTYDFSAKYRAKPLEARIRSETGQLSVEAAWECHERDYAAYLRIIGDRRTAAFSNTEKTGEERDPAARKHAEDYESVLGQLGKPSERHGSMFPGMSEPQIRRHVEDQAMKQEVNDALEGRGWGTVKAVAPWLHG